MNKYTSYRANFQSELNNIKASELKLDKKDYDIKKYEQRKKIVIDKIEKISPFLDSYFLEYFKFNLSNKDELSEEINICKIIESYASYLLNSNDLEKEKQQKYKILNNDDFKKILLAEKELSDIQMNVILETKFKNRYKNTNLKITNKDLNICLQKEPRKEDIELANVLKEYEKLKIFLKKEMKKIKNGEESDYTLYQITHILAGIIADMCDAKRMILGIRNPAKRLGDESPMNDFSLIDYSNFIHIKKCLRNCDLNQELAPDSMISHIAYDLKVAIKELQKRNCFDDIDMNIIYLYNKNYTIRYISKVIERDTKTVQQRLKKICKKISNFL